jgi:Asp-tRNA(Asn)/Glu-tRNA(Gln) amidotransferase A subunit family amidase
MVPELVQPTSLAETARRCRDGDRAAGAELADWLDRLDTVEPEVEAFVSEGGRRERVLSAAERLPEAPPPERPPLYGVPVGVKDVFRVDGLPTGAGSDLPAAALAGPEAAVIERLRAAGAVVLGKTVTTEFAYFHPGPTRNPHDTAHTPGGSSSGSAAAVAAGEVPVALGTQTAGSTIRPAAFCGVVGMKPSYGRIPTDGLLPLAPSLDHVGLFTAAVDDMRLAASVCCDEWRAIDAPNDPVLAVPDGPYLEQAEQAGLTGFERAVDALEAAGYRVRRVDALEDVETVNDRHTTLLAGEAALVHHDWYTAHADAYHGTTVDLVERGRGVSTEALATARASRVALRERLTERLTAAGADCWLAPAAPGPAPEGLESTGDVAMNLPWTHAGLPVVSLPAGAVDGLPLGVQIVGRFGADEYLLDRCAGLEEVVAAI